VAKAAPVKIWWGRAIHELSSRSDRQYLALNCGVLAPTLVGSELFGHERGSFTGASRQHKGYFERASGGTLLLDEVTEMAPDLQRASAARAGNRHRHSSGRQPRNKG